MNIKILSRLEKLENDISSTKQGPTTIHLVALNAEGHPEKEPISARAMGKEWQLDRGHAETVDDFKVRVNRLVPRSANGLAIVFFRYDDNEAN